MPTPRMSALRGKADIVGSAPECPNAPEALKQVCVAAGSTRHITKPANLRGAGKGDRVELAGSHIVDDSEHPRIVGFKT